MAMAPSLSRNAAARSLAALSARPRPRPDCAGPETAWRRPGGCRAGRRTKSSVPFLPGPSSSHDEVYERAARNAAEFDAHYGLGKDDTVFSTWRSRQMVLTRSDPVTAHPKSLVKVVSTSPERPPSFFPPYAHSGLPPVVANESALIHNQQSIVRMRNAGRLARKLLDYVCHPSVSRPGRTTEEVDDLLHSMCLAQGAYPSPLNYAGFPKSVCSSIDEVVCHGIPDSRPLRAGDIASFDVSCYIKGVHGDNCATVVVGDVEEGIDPGEFDWDAESERGAGEGGDRPRNQLPPKATFASAEEEERFVSARRLVQAAIESRDEGIAACRPGGCLSEIGGAIHAVADAYGYDTVRVYRGHGISSDFHHAPFVKHFRNDDAMELLPGMIFTIEPMITEGSAVTSEWSDLWTVTTLDGGRAAQFEHTVLITETGVEVLTLP